MEGKLANGEIIIRDATGDDMSLVAEMAQELADFENMSTRPKITAKDLRRDGFESERPQFRCKLAEVQGTGMVIGFAVFYPTYSTWEGRAMMLKNLFVKERYRRRGVGRMLFCAVITEAVASGCVRVDLHVLAWNPARRFYGRIGAQDLTERQGVYSYSLSGDAFKSLASKTYTVKNKSHLNGLQNGEAL